MKLIEGEIIDRDIVDYLPLSVINMTANIRKEVKLNIMEYKESFIFLGYQY